MHRVNGRKWYGYTDDPVRRKEQHASNPVKSMRADVPAGHEFYDVFTFNVLYEYGCQRAAEYCEARLIQRYHTTQKKFGYNTLSSKPAWSSKYYYLKSRGKLSK
jgi:hypothetical protein